MEKEKNLGGGSSMNKDNDGEREWGLKEMRGREREMV